MAMVSAHREQMNIPIHINLEEQRQRQRQEQEQEREQEQRQEQGQEQRQRQEQGQIKEQEQEHGQEQGQGQGQKKEQEQELEEEEEEVGEEILVLLEDEEDTNNNQDLYYLQQESFDIPLEEEELVDDQQQQQQQQLMDQGDEAFYLANRTFYTTCHKISRQNSPSYRKRPPYTFLENWLIHSVFSKSQQILLRFPVIHPKVMMTEGDFIYTPHQMATNNENAMDQTMDHDQSYYENDLQQQQHDQQQLDYDYGDDEEYDYYDDTFIIGDEGVMVMSASAPDASQFMADDDVDDDDDSDENDHNQVSHSSLHASSLVMDENMWMGHSRYNSNGSTLHVVNPDESTEDEEDQDPMYHNVVSSYNKPSTVAYQGQLQMVKEEEEEEEDDDDDEEEEDQHQAIYDYHQEPQFNNDVHSNLSMSPEVLNWYRSADLRPVNYNNNTVVVDDGHHLLATCDEEQQPDKTANYGCSKSSSSTSSENSSCSISQLTDNHSAHSDEKSIITDHSSGSYQSLANIALMEEEAQEDDTTRTTSYGTLLPSHYQSRSMVVQSEQQKKHVSPVMQVSVCLVDAAWVALDLAQNYVEDVSGTKGVAGFITNVFKIWKVLFLGAETMLGWGSHRLKPETDLVV